MPIKNKVMLITYPDSLGKNLQELSEVLENDLKGAVGGIHLLPFFLQRVIAALHQLITRQLILNLVIGQMLKSWAKNTT